MDAHPSKPTQGNQQLERGPGHVGRQVVGVFGEPVRYLDGMSVKKIVVLTIIG